MKSKLILLLFAMAMTTASYGIVVGDFEGGSMEGWWAANWNTGDYAVPSASYATTGSGSLEGHIANGGWNLVAEMSVKDHPDGALLQSGLATVGQITLDVTSFYNTGSSNDYTQLCILVNVEGMWDVFGYIGVQNGVTETITFQLPQNAMDAIGAAVGWYNIGILSNHSPTELSEPDPITGEQTVVFDGAITHYIDNVQIAVPEPATLSLLGLGALAMIRRKR